MKKRSLLKTMLLLCALIVGYGSAWGQVTIWSENFNGLAADATPTVPTNAAYTGVTYTCTNGAGTSPGTTKIMNDNLATGASAPEMMVGKKGSGTGAAGGKFTAVIPLDNFEGTLTLTYYQNKQTLNVRSTTAGVSGGQSTKPSEAGQQTTTFTGITTSMTSITIVFEATTTNNVRLDDIVLTGYKASGIATPTFSPAGGTYTSTQSVTISCTTTGADIYYTLDGTIPTANSTQYTGAINVSETKTIKAIAKKGDAYSPVSTATYTILPVTHAGTQADPYTVADARNAIDAGVGVEGVYVKGIISQIDEVSTANGNATYWISDDGTTTNQLQAYRGKYLENAAFTSADQINVTDKVVIVGNLTKYGNKYEFDTGNYLYSLTPDERSEANLSWSASEIEIAKGAAESEYTLPTLVNPNNVTPITYTITGTEDLAIEVDGEILVDTDVEGSVTVTASFAGNDDYKSATASYTIVVYDATVKGTKYNPYTIAEVIDGTATGSNIYVLGYIVGEFVGKTTNPKTSGFGGNSNVAVADAFSASPAVADCIPVELPSSPSSIRTNWGLQNNPTVVGYQILFKGNADTYFTVKGIKGTSEITAKALCVTTKEERNYATYVIKHNLDFSQANGVSAYIATGFNSGKTAVTLQELDVVPANTPIIVKTDTKGAAVNVPVTAAEPDNVIGNLLLAGPAALTGDGTEYILVEDKFYQATAGNLAAGKAYLKLTEPLSAPQLNLSFDGEGTTAIDEVRSKTEEVREGIFDLSGRRVEKPTKGIYIVNGKKYVVK